MKKKKKNREKIISRFITGIIMIIVFVCGDNKFRMIFNEKSEIMNVIRHNFGPIRNSIKLYEIIFISADIIISIEPS